MYRKGFDIHLRHFTLAVERDPQGNSRKTLPALFMSVWAGFGALGSIPDPFKIL
jgi:hypothetical protein